MQSKFHWGKIQEAYLLNPDQDNAWNSQFNYHY